MYNDTPNGTEGGIWQSGAGISADSSGNIYFGTGNGTFDLSPHGRDAGDTILKMSPQNGLTRVDYFTPFNQSCLEQELVFTTPVVANGEVFVGTANSLNIFGLLS